MFGLEELNKNIRYINTPMFDQAVSNLKLLQGGRTEYSLPILRGIIPVLNIRDESLIREDLLFEPTANLTATGYYLMGTTGDYYLKTTKVYFNSKRNDNKYTHISYLSNGNYIDLVDLSTAESTCYAIDGLSNQGVTFDISETVIPPYTSLYVFCSTFVTASMTQDLIIPGWKIVNKY